MNESLTVADGQVVRMDYTLQVDGQMVDDSAGHGPIEFLQGKGNIIPGLERELYGLSVGESKEVIVPAAEGYGETDHDAFMEVPRDDFPKDVPMEIGTILELHDKKDQPMHARIDRIGEETVRLDFNHPMAGKELHFSVKIAGLRLATQEELEHGHVHGAEHQH